MFFSFSLLHVLSTSRVQGLAPANGWLAIRPWGVPCLGHVLLPLPLRPDVRDDSPFGGRPMASWTGLQPAGLISGLQVGNAFQHFRSPPPQTKTKQKQNKTGWSGGPLQNHGPHDLQNPFSEQTQKSLQKSGK